MGLSVISGHTVHAYASSVNYIIIVPFVSISTGFEV